MKINLNILALAVIGASSLLAQQQNSSESHLPVTLGFKIGVPVTDMFSASNTTLFNGNESVPGSAYTSAVPRYTFGISAEFHLPYHLRFEVDGLYKRAGFATQTLGAGYGGVGTASQFYNTSANVFEIPGVFKYNISMGHFRPFVDFGASMRHIATVKQSSVYTDRPLYYINDNTPELSNRNSVGAVAGFGITFKEGPFELTPEARYTRWANQSFSAMGLRTNLDQGDILLGISF
jgi:hypothetical protein